MIEIGKTYQTRHGWPARVHATDLDGTYPVLASMQKPHGGWIVVRLTADGLYDNPNHVTDLDLVEVKPQITITRWVNVYRSTTEPDGYCLVWHSTEEEAKKLRVSNDYIMTVPVTITGREGDGL